MTRISGAGAAAPGLVLAALLAVMAGQAQADPCEAIPQDGPMPGYLSFGSSFSGPVTHVIDGDSLCVAVGPGPENLVEVRVSDFYAPELSSPAGPAAKAALEHIALGRQASCVAGLRTYDRVAARCRIDGRSVGDLMRSAGIAEGGNGLREPRPSVAATLRPSAPSRSWEFRNCAAARAAGAAPVRFGDPGYGPHLDADGDGIACEPMPRAYRRR